MAGNSCFDALAGAMLRDNPATRGLAGAGAEHSRTPEGGKALREVLGALPDTAGRSPGAEPRIADCLLAPVLFYAALTPDAAAEMVLPGVRGWCDLIRADAADATAAPGRD